MNRFQRSVSSVLFAIVLGVVVVRVLLPGIAYILLSFFLRPTEAMLVASLEQETGVILPSNAKIVFQGGPPDFFGLSGLLKAKVACQDMGQLKNVSGSVFNRQDRFEVIEKPQKPILDIWWKSRFRIPAGSHVMEYNPNKGLEPGEPFFEVIAVYAIDSKNCTVHYQRVSLE